MQFEDEDGLLLSQIFHSKKRPLIIYEYDFGDSWQHENTLETTLMPEPKIKYPRCVESSGPPPEDCGGAWGYAEFLEAMADPKHENHRDQTCRRSTLSIPMVFMLGVRHRFEELGIAPGSTAILRGTSPGSFNATGVLDLGLRH